MAKVFNPKQTVLFPELFEDAFLPSITTLPDFDQALENFVRLSDFGALIDLNFHGIDKSYSLRLDEIQIPPKYLKSQTENQSPVFNLFSADVRNRINRMKYDVRSFFIRTNHLKTPYGYFLFRKYFHKWDVHKKNKIEGLREYFTNEIGEAAYREYFQRLWRSGIDWIKSNLAEIHPYILTVDPDKELPTERKNLRNAGTTTYQLDRNDRDLIVRFLILKIMHVPETLAEYTDGISILSMFKTIHLDYLKDVKIESIEDIEQLFQSIPQNNL
ncbi:MAG: hypothetical protein PHW79_04185 [Candidatus Marinimicrobia bacterium]|nr:hypothetical protein [Candidatus Neomarinimicrobiota bacterium]